MFDFVPRFAAWNAFSCSQALRWSFLLALGSATLCASVGPSSAHADERTRYAKETAGLRYEQFLARKRRFVNAGCEKPPRQIVVPFHCNKPWPYNEYDWTTDGCSGGPVKGVIRTLFRGPCEVHDFGYRNLGNGLSLSRSESMRRTVDDHLWREAQRVCGQKYPARLQIPNKEACLHEANLMRTFFRNSPILKENWDKPCKRGKCYSPSPRESSGPVTPLAPEPDVPAAPAGTDPGPSGGVPAGSIPETAGGVAHTWTDFRSAGGTQGASVQPGQTVGIECKTEGFRVANGNTWWYKIASSPWNGAFYVSADAFYNNGQTSGSLAGTPFVDPAVPDCAGSTQPPVDGGTAETAGGVTHTWTNYTNAGGTQGPSIQAGQTVAVACKIQGFRVADGNTWWYKIASSPWNGAYFASADAFYNNGRTSGSLLGTPFVDTAVPDCAGPPPPPPPPPPPTWAETTGGVAHTWTNYTNAGGTQGPSIASNQTVQIACKIQGFRVADGNTWWYKIASSPWNGAYYVSADAFYNNGQTSGSLLGTPFVDPNVANC